MGWKVNVTENLDTGALHAYATHTPLAIPFHPDVPLRLIIKGTSGSGKTILTYRVLGQLVQNFGMSPITFLDPKSEMLPEPNREFPMMPNETPIELDYKAFAPKFIQSPLRGRTEIEIAVCDFEAEELLSMFYGNSSIPAGVRDVLEDAMLKAKNFYKDGRYTIEQLMSQIDDLQNVNEISKRSARNIIRSLARRQIISDKTNFNFMEDLLEGTYDIVQFDMRHEIYPSLTSCYVSYCIRKLMVTIGENRGRALRFSKIRPFFIIDESRLICPPSPSNPPSKQQLASAFGVTRGIGISMCLTTLNLNLLDKSIISNSSFVITIGKLGADFAFLRQIVEPQLVQNTEEICAFDVTTGRRIAALWDLNAGKVQYFIPMVGGIIPQKRKI